MRRIAALASAALLAASLGIAGAQQTTVEPDNQAMCRVDYWAYSRPGVSPMQGRPHYACTKGANYWGPWRVVPGKM